MQTIKTPSAMKVMHHARLGCRSPFIPAKSSSGLSCLSRRKAQVQRISAVNIIVYASSEGAGQGSEPEVHSYAHVDEVSPLHFAAAGTVLAQLALPLCLDGGSGGGSGASGGSGGGGGGDGSGHGSRWQEAFTLAEDTEEEEEEEEEEGEEGEEDEETEEEDEDASPENAPPQSFTVSEVVATGLPVGEGIPTQDDLLAGLHCQSGETLTRAELSHDVKTLYRTNLFESITTRVLPGKRGKSQVVFDFIEKKYPPLVSFNVEGAKHLPPRIIDELQRDLEKEKGNTFTMKTMAKIKNKIEGWYHTLGYGLCYIEHFTGMPTGEVVAHVREGKTNRVNIVYMDEDGQPLRGGKIPASYIKTQVPIEEGTLYNMNDGRKTLQNVFAMDLFDNVQILPRQNERDPSKVEVDVMVREKPTQTADIEAEWGLAAGESGWPALGSIVPGGTISYENRNLGRRVGTLSASVNTKSFLSPSDDLSFRVTYSQPYLHGLKDPKRTKLQASIFNGRKLCGVFTPGPGGQEVPPVWIDRAGAKLSVTESYSRQSRGTLALVAQEVSARDETGALCTRGMRATPMGQYVQDGPPTTLSPTGRDRMVYAQGSLVRDTTYLVNGGQVGSRDIYTVDQGLGIGTKSPLFNRCTAQLTRFLQLHKPGPRSRAAPITLVLHGRAGNCVGDLPTYDAFQLGGPHSVRGYNFGELATCRRFVEGAAELRVPVKGQTAYAFYETGTDLGSSSQVRGNPSEYFRRVGRGSSLGGGLKIGALIPPCLGVGLLSEVGRRSPPCAECTDVLTELSVILLGGGLHPASGAKAGLDWWGHVLW